MLRVGLTGSLGSGKSTVAALLRELGAHVIEADELGRALMEPGQPVYAEIVRTFGPEVVSPDGRLNRPRLAKLAFEEGRLHDLNAIVHPAVIAAQKRWMGEIFARDPAAIAVVESALIFEVERDARARAGHPGPAPAGPPSSLLADWRSRFDRIIVLTAPDDLKIARYAARFGPPGPARDAAARDARLRLARQIPDPEKAARADFVLPNTGSFDALRDQVRSLYATLRDQSNKYPSRGSLE